MADLIKTTHHLTNQRVFRETVDAPHKFDPESMGVALVDADGGQTGTASRPISINADVLIEILDQLKILNFHMMQITGESIGPEET